jgi:hypothetical protein
MTPTHHTALEEHFSVYPKYPTCSPDQQLGKVAGSGGVTRQILAHQPLLPGRLYILFTFVLAKIPTSRFIFKIKLKNNNLKLVFL